MIVVGGQVGKLPAGPIASTGLESSSSPKLRFVFATVPNGGSTVGSQSRGSLRVKAVEGSMTVSGSGKVDDLYDESRNGHAANSGEILSQLSTIASSRNIKWHECAFGKVASQNLLKSERMRCVDYGSERFSLEEEDL